MYKTAHFSCFFSFFRSSRGLKTPGHPFIGCSYEFLLERDFGNRAIKINFTFFWIFDGRDKEVAMVGFWWIFMFALFGGIYTDLGWVGFVTNFVEPRSQKLLLLLDYNVDGRSVFIKVFITSSCSIFVYRLRPSRRGLSYLEVFSFLKNWLSLLYL